MQNIVKLDDGIIYYAQVGNQTKEIAWNTLSLIRLLAGGLTEVKLLVDYSEAGGMDDEAIQSGYYALESLPIDQAAIIGATAYIRNLVMTMGHAAGKGNTINFAKSRKSAIDWLNK